jgi:hypothetical protein
MNDKTAPNAECADIVSKTFNEWFYSPDGTPRTKEQRVALLTSRLKIAAALGFPTPYSAEQTDEQFLLMCSTAAN